MKLIIGVIILQVIIYTWVHLYLSYKVGIELSPTVSLGFYTFCAGEAGISGWIKVSKCKVKNKEEEYIE